MPSAHLRPCAGHPLITDSTLTRMVARLFMTSSAWRTAARGLSATKPAGLKVYDDRGLSQFG